MLPFQASRPGSDGNKGVLSIPLSSSINGASPSDYLVSYPRHSLRESYSSAKMQSVYSTAPANLAMLIIRSAFYIHAHIYIYITFLYAHA